MSSPSSSEPAHHEKEAQPSGHFGPSDQSGPTHCCSNHTEDEELEHLKEIIDSFFYYNTFHRKKLTHKIEQFQTLSAEHKKLLEPHHSEHTRELMRCITQNQSILEMLVCEGSFALGPLGEKALYAHDGRSAHPDNMSKINSTLKQIVREWSNEGKSERDATFLPLLRELESRFPERDREREHVLVPGSGLSRLAWEIACAGFTTVACESSSFMLIVSFVLLNILTEPNEFTIHPYLSTTSNQWSYGDRTRAVTFPDVCPTTISQRADLMSMRPGNFLTMFEGQEGRYSAIVTAWFIDTAHNVIEYIEHINRLLKVGGVWLNSGPLTYHYGDTPDEVSIDLPLDEIIRIAVLRGFRIEKERRAEPSLYAADRKSMLRYTYECAFFVAVKEADLD